MYLATSSVTRDRSPVGLMFRGSRVRLLATFCPRGLIPGSCSCAASGTDLFGKQTTLWVLVYVAPR
jgi:hypothetical protein